MITICLIMPIWDKTFGNIGQRILATFVVMAIDSIYILPALL